MNPDSASETRGVRSTASPLDAGAFAPGTMLAERYRIVALAGRGGMGEVYRAEDLRLGQTVALKFLPAGLERDPGAHERLVAEVRSARAVSHPNVCRVYDVGEVQGRWFLTMEYIDGEDLASLLRRIGRLPADKALEVARQLSAALAAAHDKGVLHRDLKPSNVMIDGRGQARLTDFGLAVETGLARSPADFAGTAAYMAPERFHGQPATVQSDLYALGLILYEAFTGKAAFKAGTLGDWQQAHTGSTPANPSEFVSDLQPAVARVILQCLEKDPARRPASAAQVAAALPGGDPLAAALARGETPAPELVAAAGETGAIGVRAALATLALTVAAIVAVVELSPLLQLTLLVPLPKAPAVLRDRAQQLVRTLGHPETGIDMSAGFAYSEYGQHVSREARPRSELRSSQPSGLVYWYRESPQALTTLKSAVTADDPPESQPGMVGVRTDTAGRLRRFVAVPPSRDPGPSAHSMPADWSVVFREAGLDATQYTSVAPRLTPPVHAEVRAAWDGVYPLRHDIPIHIEAAMTYGRISYFEIFEPWSERMQGGARATPDAQRLLSAFLLVIFVAALGGSVGLAARNVRLGRGDRRGAARIAALFFCAAIVAGMLRAGHQIDVAPFMASLFRNVADSLLGAGLAWTGYLAAEPFVRRRWPHMLISWTRLLAGRWRDPLVGRDILAGTAVGAMTQVLGQATQLTNPGINQLWSVWQLDGMRAGVAAFLGMMTSSLLLGMGFLLLFFLVALVFRRRWIATVAVLVYFGVSTGLENASLAGGVLYGVLGVGLLLGGLLRFGLVTLIVGIVCANLLDMFPITLDPSQWFSWMSYLTLAIVLGLAAFGTLTAADVRSAVGRVLREEP